MKVKVGDRVYDGEKEPVMVILSDDDKKNIASMSPKDTKYCSFPTSGVTPGEVQEWVEDVPNSI